MLLVANPTPSPFVWYQLFPVYTIQFPLPIDARIYQWANNPFVTLSQNRFLPYPSSKAEVNTLTETLLKEDEDLNVQWGYPLQRRSIGLELTGMPLERVQTLFERGLNVNGIVPVLSPGGREMFSATPLSEALAVSFRDTRQWEVRRNATSLVQLLIFNGAVLKPNGNLHERYEDNIEHIARKQVLWIGSHRIVKVKDRLEVRELHEWNSLWDVMRQSFLLCRLFNACLDRQLAIPSPLPYIVEKLFTDHCEIDPLRIKEIYSIVSDYLGAWGLPRSYLALHYSESNLLESLVKHYAPNGKLPNGNTNLTQTEGAPPIFIQELVDTNLATTHCIEV